MDERVESNLRGALERWEAETVASAARKTPELRPEFRTWSGEFVVKRLYTPLDDDGRDYLRDLGFPGEYPFTRGIEPLGLRAREWPRYYYSGFGSPEDANERLLSLIRSGSDYISIALDLPTQLGLDSDHELADGEVGKAGVAIDTLEDLDRLLQGIPLDRVRIGAVANSIAPWWVAMLVALMERRGIDPAKTFARIQNDPLKEYNGRGTQIFPVRVAIDLASDVVEFCHRRLPRWHPQYATTTTMRWGGCSVTQEVGFGIANLIAYVDAARDKQVPLEDLVPKLDLHMTATTDLFEEVAKFRATRRLWARIARSRFQTNDPRVLALRISVFTHATQLTAQQPLNNIIRTTLQVLAAILGGVQQITVPAYDEAIALPTFQSTWVASMTRHIITEEGLVGQSVDPMGGSYYLEALTDQIEAGAVAWFNQVQELGGAVECAERGIYLRHMAEGMYRYQQQIESGERTVIGINKFVLDEEEGDIEIFRPNPEWQNRQVARLNEVRARRDGEAVAAALSHLKSVADRKRRGEKINIVPYMLEAVKAYVTVGEIFGALREVFGEARRAIVY